MGAVAFPGNPAKKSVRPLGKLSEEVYNYAQRPRYRSKFALKDSIIQNRPGLRPGPTWGAHSAPPDPLARARGGDPYRTHPRSVLGALIVGASPVDSRGSNEWNGKCPL
jgi:hypothetical protein